ncbi:bone marrow stromal antigen 2 [Nannospalax galili]|uniref:bone marrow stromal antigen 2 n=1 Tax=Nannospalax galili TaxID=1026970 RepID=UPI0004ED07B3|nr:bone marrow stromal antigen 2 [Nannospalax galili]
MAPVFYHRAPVSMEELLKGELPRGRLPLLAAGLAVLACLALLIPLIFFAVKASSEACQDGLRADRECRNTTHLLQSQLKRAQDGLLQAENEAHTCNQTVVTLKAALEEKMSQALEQHARIEELERNITILNEKLKNTLEEQEKLRKEKETLRSVLLQNSVSSLAASSLPMLLVPLVLVLLF